MRYIESNLLANEKLIYGVRPHWIIFSSACWAILFAFFIWIFAPDGLAVPIVTRWNLRDIAGAVFFLVGMYWLISAYIYYKTSEYAITNKRVLIKVGWIERKSLELLLDKVEGVLVDQTILGRILNFGSINIIGTGGTNDRFPFIPDPLSFRKNVQQQIELYEEMMRRPRSQ
jgi:uncharacterized membrane protein YdbT with pleckstrin-like domain